LSTRTVQHLTARVCNGKCGTTVRDTLNAKSTTKTHYSFKIIHLKGV